MSTTTTTKPTTSTTRHVPHSEGETHPVMGDPMRFIMTAEQAGGAYALAEQEIRPGNGAPPHIHRNEDESLYILEGEFAATVDGVERRLRAGDYIHVPRGRVRSFTNVGPGHGRLLILHVPGSASAFYIAMGKLPFPPDMADVAALAKRHGIELAMDK